VLPSGTRDQPKLMLDATERSLESREIAPQRQPHPLRTRRSGKLLAKEMDNLNGFFAPRRDILRLRSMAVPSRSENLNLLLAPGEKSLLLLRSDVVEGAKGVAYGVGSIRRETVAAWQCALPPHAAPIR
jgi:hypothetical protein